MVLYTYPCCSAIGFRKRYPQLCQKNRSKSHYYCHRFGSRFWDDPQNVPKMFIRSVDKPIIQYPVEECAGRGLRGDSHPSPAEVTNLKIISTAVRRQYPYTNDPSGRARSLAQGEQVFKCQNHLYIMPVR